MNLAPILEGHAPALFANGKVAEALALGNEGIATARKAVETEKRLLPVLVQALENMGEMLRNDGQLEDALRHYREALELAEKAKLEPSIIAEILTSLATTTDAAGHEAESLPIYEQAIKQLEALEPPEERTAAQLRNNLALNYKRANKLALAEQHYLRALEIMEAQDGPTADVASIYNNLGGLYYAAGFAGQAKEMFEEAMTIRSRVLGTDHRDLAQAHCNLATVEHELGNSDAAQRHYELSLRIYETNIRTEADSYRAVGQDYLALLGSLNETRKSAVFQKRMDKVLSQLNELPLA